MIIDQLQSHQIDIVRDPVVLKRTEGQGFRLHKQVITKTTQFLCSCKTCLCRNAVACLNIKETRISEIRYTKKKTCPSSFAVFLPDQ